MSEEHITKVGRYSVRDTARTLKLSDGAPGISYEEAGRLELRAVATVLSRVDLVGGAELKFARKAMGLRQPELARMLGVTTETVCRWETGSEPFKRQTQLAVLRLVEEVARSGRDALARDLVRAGEQLDLQAEAC